MKQLLLAAGGFGLGVVVCMLCMRKQMPPRIPSDVKLKVPVEWRWNDELALKSGTLVQIEGRLWAEGGGLIIPDDVSNEFWLKGVPPWKVGTRSWHVTDSSYTAIDWWLRAYNGALCRISGSTGGSTATSEPLDLILAEINSVNLISGIAVSFEDLIAQMERYHGVVVHLKGVVGRNAAIGGTYIFESPTSLEHTQFDRSIKLERRFAGPADNNFELLRQEGAIVEVDGLFQRPWKNDASAPSGSLVIIHKVTEGKH